MTATIIIPFAVNDANFTSSNVPENDYAAWLVGTTYAAGARVISTATHLIYESVAAGNTGNNPTTAANVPSLWLKVGSTNRWRAFDNTLGQSTTNLNTITYVFGTTSRMDAVAFVGLVAISVQVVVRNAANAITYNVTRNVLDISNVQDWLGFVTFNDPTEPEVVFDNISAVSGASVSITITTASGGTAEVAEIIPGRSEIIGTILAGTHSGFTDYSRKEIDDFGNITIVKRPTSRRAEWQILFLTASNRRIQRALEDARAAPAFFYAGDNLSDFDVSIYGVVDDFFPALSNSTNTEATLTLIGAS